jgi:hypothetical protein
MIDKTISRFLLGFTASQQSRVRPIDAALEGFGK